MRGTGNAMTPLRNPTGRGLRWSRSRDNDSRQAAWALGGGIGMGPITADIAYTFGAVFGDERFISLTVRW
jgi:hypothetical protein